MHGNRNRRQVFWDGGSTNEDDDDQQPAAVPLIPCCCFWEICSCRVIDLEKLLSVDPSLTDFNFTDAIGVLFIRTSDGGLSTVDIKCGHVRRLPGCYMDCDHVVPILA